MYDVITVGSATVDVFVYTESELIKIKSRKEEEELIAYPSGSKILIEELEFMTGGGGTNTAVSFARLGHNVAYLGKLGKDDGGKRVLKELKKHKIDFIGKKGDGMTAYSVILNSIEHDRTILAYKGIMDSFSFNDIDTKKLKTKWFYFSSLVEESFEVLEQLAEYASDHNIKIAFNPSSYLAEKGSDYLAKVLNHTHILVLNKEEAELIVGRGEIKSLLKKLKALGPKIVVITHGKEGAYCLKEKFYFIRAHKIKVREATGAGDSFASAFTSAIMRKKDIPFALKLGLANAESVITHKGAKGKLLTYAQAKKHMKKNPAKVTNV